MIDFFVFVDNANLGHLHAQPLTRYQTKLIDKLIGPNLIEIWTWSQNPRQKLTGGPIRARARLQS